MTKARIEDLEHGAKVNFGGVTWILLENQSKGGLCLSSTAVSEKPFNEEEEQNWKEASIKGYLNDELLKQLIEGGGSENSFVEMEVDLTALDEGTDYGIDKCKVALLTAGQYETYKSLIPALEIPYWFITPYSCNEFYLGGAYTHFIRFMRPDGTLEGCAADGGLYGVRPIVCLKPETEVVIVNSVIYNKVLDLMEMLGRTTPITFTTAAKSLVSEIAVLCNQIPFVQSTKDQAEVYAEDLTSQQVYLDMLTKIVDAPTSIHMAFAVYGLIPVLDEKLQQEEENE